MIWGALLVFILIYAFLVGVGGWSIGSAVKYFKAGCYKLFGVEVMVSIWMILCLIRLFGTEF